jgi:ATP-dependent RNA helicase HelY
MFTIVLADDHQILRESVRKSFESAGESVVGEASNGEDAVRLADQLRPDVVLMDISMPLLDGVAAHHAGLVPLFKEIIEALFQQGLIKIVFATETLALGINMPARSVVIERLEKYDGEGHVLLTAGQYTQLTGRAGRRGIDPVGHAVVLHQRSVEFRQVAGLVGTRSYPLHSSFRP